MRLSNHDYGPDMVRCSPIDLPGITDAELAGRSDGDMDFQLHEAQDSPDAYGRIATTEMLPGTPPPVQQSSVTGRVGP